MSLHSIFSVTSVGWFTCATADAVRQVAVDYSPGVFKTTKGLFQPMCNLPFALLSIACLHTTCSVKAIAELDRTKPKNSVRIL